MLPGRCRAPRSGCVRLETAWRHDQGGENGLRGRVAYEDYEQTAEQALIELGFQVEPPGGVFEALRGFRASAGLEVNGSLDTPTWLALGLPLPADPDAPVTGLEAGIQDPS